MKRFEAIAVLLSQTPQDAPILRRAIELTKNNEASLSVYSVLDEPALVAEVHVARSSRREILRQVKLIRRKILNSVPCSVLAVKPSGFVSPVPPETHRGRTT